MAFEVAEVGFDAYVEDLAERGGDRRGAHRRRGCPQPERPAAGDAARRARGALDPRPAARRSERAGYLGCRFPADPAYAAAITREAGKVGERLARGGRDRPLRARLRRRAPDGGWDPYAIELNLRKGGTTHPFLTLQFLTDGVYDPETGVFTAPSGREKHFVASDHVESPRYRELTPDDLFDIVVRRGLHFDQSRETGVVFHMMSALGEHGRTGLTAVADDPAGADELYERVVAVLDEEAREASPLSPAMSGGQSLNLAVTGAAQKCDAD